ncbi:hypothetical protein HMPREF0653_01357 [Prevotella disiens JCM 6334 = ATCC 29426]|uniref:Uncharacterized protein n=1 Tax=Prevotella disiens JCM 6334 = ATCC 29426 TaxID=1235811 RepID=A0ABN0NS58_9BACT|nr:hypothetical protein HMPREF0653_01357 [Prevotella disiens JCM 6334 = ATCC 29426]
MFKFQKSLFCTSKEPVLHFEIACFGMKNNSFLNLHAELHF